MYKPGKKKEKYILQIVTVKKLKSFSSQMDAGFPKVKRFRVWFSIYAKKNVNF